MNKEQTFSKFRITIDFDFKNSFTKKTVERALVRAFKSREFALLTGIFNITSIIPEYIPSKNGKCYVTYNIFEHIEISEFDTIREARTDFEHNIDIGTVGYTRDVTTNYILLFDRTTGKSLNFGTPD